MNNVQDVLAILRETRAFVLPMWGKAEKIKQKDEQIVNAVTAIDLQVEEFASDKLKKLYQDISFVGEECGGDREAERFWLMDPIDGTLHFMRGTPFCTTMLALVEEGQVTFGAIYDFINDTMYWAEQGKGAYQDTARLHVSTRPLAQGMICWETHFDKEENRATLNRLRERAIIMNTICSGWDYAMVAAGKIDGRVCFDPFAQDYDVAPGTLLITEAGGVVTNIGSSSFDYRNTNLIAGNPIVHKELTEGPDAIFPVA